jgi:predicted nucleic acid-binding Zn ribbon protein
VDPTQTLVPRLLRDLGLEAGVVGWRAVEIWPEVAGSRIAHRTRATGFRDGVLHVEVDGSVWAYELEFLKRRFLEELRQRVGSHVRDLRFVTRGGIQR